MFQILNGVQIVCSRSILRTLGLSPYVPRGWTIAIEKYNDIFFLKELQKSQDKENVHQSSIFGFMFENIIFDYSSNEISMREGMYATNLIEFESANDKEEKIKVFTAASIDGLDGDQYVEAKTRDPDNDNKKLDFWLQTKFASVGVFIHGIKSEEEDGVWIRKIRKETLDDFESTIDEDMRKNSLGTIHKIFNALVSKYDDYMSELMKNGSRKSQPQILMAKRGCRSKEIFFSENPKPTKILTSKFKKQFAEIK